MLFLSIFPNKWDVTKAANQCEIFAICGRRQVAFDHLTSNQKKVIFDFKGKQERLRHFCSGKAFIFQKELCENILSVQKKVVSK